MDLRRSLRHFFPHLVYLFLGFVLGTLLSVDSLRQGIFNAPDAGQKKAVGYQASISFTDASKFTYEKKSVAFDSRGARSIKPQTATSLIFLDSIKAKGKYRLTSFSEKTVNAAPGQVRYQVTTEPQTWYYHDGHTWVNASHCDTCLNTASEISSHISTLPVLSERIRVKAVIDAGTTSPILNKVSFGIFGVKPQLNPRQNSIRALTAKLKDATDDTADSTEEDITPTEEEASTEEPPVPADENNGNNNGNPPSDQGDGAGTENEPSDENVTEPGEQGNEEGSDEEVPPSDEQVPPENANNGNGPKKQCEDGDDQCDDGLPKVTICHRTNAELNPYVVITVSQSSVDGEGANDHTHHVVDAQHPRADIIPISDRDGNGVINEMDCIYDPNQHQNLPPVAVDDSATTNQDTPVTIDVLANDSDPDGILVAGTVVVTSLAANGVTAVNPVTGEILYTPDPGWSGVDTFSYQVCDNDGACDDAIVTVTVITTQEENLPPVANNDGVVTDKDTAVIIIDLANDSDPDGTLIPGTVTVIDPPTNGTAVPNPDGTITYTPNPGFVGTDTFVYQVCDNGGLCDTATVSILIVDPDVNQEKVTICHRTESASNPYVVIDVPPDSIDGEGVNDHTLHIADADHLYGDIIPITDVNGDGSIDTADCVYTPPPPNLPPVAIDDSAFTTVDVPVFIDILINDSDPDGVLVPPATMVTPPSNGSFNFLTGIYTPDSGFSGLDSFVYQICDDDGACDTATVTIVISAPPIANDDSDATIINTPVVVDVLANDSDPDNGLNPASVSVTSGPSNGSTSVNLANGAITYTPNLDFYGVDSFVYQVCDNTSPAFGGPFCDSATVTITVYAPPDAVNDTAVTSIDTPVNTIVVANDTDPEGGLVPSSVTIITDGVHGTAVSNGDGTVTYTPDAGYFGSDVYTYQVCDNTPVPLGPLCDTATVTVTIKSPPIAQNDSAVTNQNESVVIDVPANDYDLDGTIDLTTVTIITPPTNGTLSVNPVNGQVTYTPTTGYAGPDSFTYQICDNDGLCDTALVTIGIAANAPPIANDDSAITLVGVPVDITILSNDSDLDGTLGLPTVTIPPTNGIVSINGSGVATYTPAPGFFGVDTFTYQVCDDDAACDTALVTITVYAPPVANDDSAVTPQNEPVIVPVLSNDTDPDLNINLGSVTIVTGPANGTVIVNPLNGDITYTPTTGFAGPTDTFVYQVCDLTPSPLGAQCDTATVTVTILLPPVAVDDAVTTPQGTPVTIPVLGNDSDPDGTLLPTTVEIVTPPPSGSVTVNTDGTITFTPAPGFTGVVTFVYQVCDNSGIPTYCDQATVSITVTPVVVPPPVVPPAPLPPATPAVVVPIAPIVGDVVVLGANEFVLNDAVGLQPSPLGSTGIVQAVVNQPQQIFIEALNAIAVSFLATGSPTEEFKAVYSPALRLWVADVNFDHAGDFTIVAKAVGPNGGVYQREINKTLSVAPGKIFDAESGERILNAEVTIMKKSQDTGVFERWNSESVGISNPFSITDGNLAIPVVPGEYYLEVSSDKHDVVRSQIATAAEHAYLTADVRLPDERNIVARTLSRLTSTKTDNFPITAHKALGSPLLEIGSQAKDVTITTAEAPAPSTLFSKIDKKLPTVMGVFGAWNTLSAQQIESFSRLGEQIDTSTVNIVAITGMDPKEVSAQYSARGSYGVTFYRPDNKFFDDYMITSLPTFVMIDANQKIKDVKIGVQTTEELVSNIARLSPEIKTIANSPDGERITTKDSGKLCLPGYCNPPPTPCQINPDSGPCDDEIITEFLKLNPDIHMRDIYNWNDVGLSTTKNAEGRVERLSFSGPSGSLTDCPESTSRIQTWGRTFSLRQLKVLNFICQSQLGSVPMLPPNPEKVPAEINLQGMRMKGQMDLSAYNGLETFWPGFNDPSGQQQGYPIEIVALPEGLKTIFGYGSLNFKTALPNSMTQFTTIYSTGDVGVIFQNKLPQLNLVNLSSYYGKNTFFGSLPNALPLGLKEFSAPENNISGNYPILPSGLLYCDLRRNSFKTNPPDGYMCKTEN